MGGSGRVVGIILIAIGLLALVITAALMASQVAGGENTVSGAILGVLLVFAAVVAPAVGVGAYLLVKGRQEQKQLSQVEQQRKLLNIVFTRGQVTIADLVLELNSTQAQVKEWIYDLVGKGLFSGYVNWDDGVLYSRQASELRAGKKCPRCGGEMAFAGKGVVRCQYCGTEIFLAT